MLRFYFGIFEAGDCIYRICPPFTATPAQAEFIALILAPAFKGKLPDGQYLAYDYA